MYDGQKTKDRKKTQMYNVRDEKEREYHSKYRGDVKIGICVIFFCNIFENLDEMGASQENLPSQNCFGERQTLSTINKEKILIILKKYPN